MTHSGNYDLVRKNVMDRLRREIQQQARRSHSPQEIEQLVIARSRKLSESERQFGRSLARNAARGECSDRYMEQVVESYD
jgi:hypothetical protein